MKRVLFVGEFSGLPTGYGNYSREVLGRLHRAGWEVAEYSAYVRDGGFDDRGRREWAPPWPVFGAVPEEGDPRIQAYEGNPQAQFGRLRFEEALLRYRPDVVTEIRDPWVGTFVTESPLRPYFRLVWMPTVDSLPTMAEWLDLYARNDATLAYTEWGADGLRRESGGRIDPLGAAPPCIDPDFWPMDRRAAKDAFGLDPDGLVVGFVSRNQPRKLHPDLFEAFARFLEVAPPGLAARTTLYCHTTYPDGGWDLPELLKEYGLLSKVLFTYLCAGRGGCGHAFPSFFASAKAHCPRCGRPTAHFPGTRRGLDRPAQRLVYNCMDVYVQFATAEGFGLGMTEAAACGVPVAAVDYSAMSEVVRKVGGFPVRVARFFRDHGTNAKRAMPDNDHLAEVLAQFLSLPADVRARKGFEARRMCEQNFDWDRTVQTWVRAFESLGPPERGWDDPLRPLHPPDFSYAGPSDTEFVTRGISLGVGRPELLNTHLHARLVRDLSWGVRHASTRAYAGDMGQELGGTVDYTRQDALNELTALRHAVEHWETMRVMGGEK
jgi:glycosyltransferase involved in cell wall biosynthesis